MACNRLKSVVLSSMKKIIPLLAVIVMVLTGCKDGKQETRDAYEDMGNVKISNYCEAYPDMSICDK